MSFFGRKSVPLGNELTAISEQTNSSRQPNVEGQLASIQNTVTELLRTWARTHSDRVWSTSLIDVFYTTSDSGNINNFTTIGNSFRAAMNNVEPSYPSSTEINWIGTQLAEYYNSQNTTATWNAETGIFTVDWVTLPTIAKETN